MGQSVGKGGGPRGFPAQMQMRHGTNYLIGMKWGGGTGFHSSRITLIVLTVSKYKACAMPGHTTPPENRAIIKHAPAGKRGKD